MRKWERLPESELSVMMVLWREREELGTGRIVELLEKEKGWSRSTTQVLLTRLEEKQFVICEKKGRLKYYKAAVEEKEYRKSETKKFVEHFYHNSYKNLIASLVEDHALSEKEINELTEMIRRS